MALTMRSIRPNSVRAKSIAAATSPGFAASIVRVATATGKPFKVSEVRANASTRQPSLCKRRTTARPTFRAPKTTADRGRSTPRMMPSSKGRGVDWIL